MNLVPCGSEKTLKIKVQCNESAIGEVLLSGTCNGVGVMNVFLPWPSISDSFFNNFPTKGGFLFKPIRNTLSWAGISDLEKMAMVFFPK